MNTVYLVLKKPEFDTVVEWINQQNGWPDGHGTERYAQPFDFNQFSNPPVPLQSRVGFVFDKALIRNIADVVVGETKKDKMVRIFQLVKDKSKVPIPSFVTVEPTGDEIDGENRTAIFTDVTDSVVEKVRALVD